MTGSQFGDDLLAQIEARVVQLQSEFVAGGYEVKSRIMAACHDWHRLENHDLQARTLSLADARLLIANQEGYAYWHKFDSFLHLKASVQMAIVAVRCGDLSGLESILRDDPEAADPKWVSGFPVPKPIPNDSVPLFCVSEGVFRKTNVQDNEYELTRALAACGAEVDIAGGLPLASAVSFGATRVVEGLLDCGAAVDGVDSDGVPMAYAMHFVFTPVAELLAERGARLDLRFAAGVGRLDLVKTWFNDDGSLKPGAGALSDPYGLERKMKGESIYRCERTRPNILSQALYFACLHKRMDVAEFLLTQGAPINAVVPGLDLKATVIHSVATMDRDYEPVIRFLLAHGADRTIRDQKYQSTPAGWASHFQRDYFAELLRVG